MIITHLSPSRPASLVAGALGWPIRAHLSLFAVLLLVPAIAFSAFLIQRAGAQQLAQAEARVVQLAVDLADDISNELERGVTILETLALSGSLERGEYSALHTHAKRILERRSDLFVVLDASGQHIVNSLVPLGSARPQYGNPEAFAKVVATRKPMVTDMFYGNTRKTWVINILYPVLRDGAVDRVLVLSLTADRVRRILHSQQLEGDWTSSVSDSRHALIARTRLHEEFVGKPLTPDLVAAGIEQGRPHRITGVDGRPVVRAVAQTRLAAWTVAVAVSEASLYAGVHSSVRGLILGGLALLALSAGLVGIQGQRLGSSIRALARPSPGGGEPLRSPVLEVNEAAALLWRAMADVRHRDETLRLALSAAYAVAFTWDIDSNVVVRLFSSEPGLAATEEATDSFEGVAKVVHPDDRAAFKANVQVALSGIGQLYRNEYRLVRPDGEVRWLDEWGTVERNPDGSPLRLVGISIDVTDRKLAAAALVASEQRFRELADSMPQLVWTADSSGSVTYFNRRREEYRTAGNEPGRWQATIHPDELGRTRKAWRDAVASTTDYECEHRVQRADGSFRWQLSRARPFQHAHGTVWYGTATDIHDLKDREERINMLLKEVNHRSKNLLSVVLSVARQTSRAGTPAEFVERLTSRVQGLSASQDLLVKSEWRGVGLEELVRAQLAPYQDLVDTRIRLAGPSLKVDASAAQTIGMAVHELATNAAVHGALSGSGTVDITWQVVDDGASPRLRLSWQERDGPTVTRPAHTGFGHTVLLRTTEHALGGRCELTYADAGLTWTLSAPLDRVADRPADR